MSADAGWVQGLKAAAVAVVAHALLGMARSLTPDRERATIAVAGMILALTVPGVAGQLTVIVLGAAAGLLWLRPGDSALTEADGLPVSVSRRAALFCLALFFLLLLLFPLLAGATGDGIVQTLDRFYRAGALVFGGGHVVLPLLQAEVVSTGWVEREAFLAGYGAAQAVPGPLFTFAAYLGTVQIQAPNGLFGAVVALLAIFLPSALLVVAALPFWARLRGAPKAQKALLGINAAVVGLLAAALYDPVFTTGVISPTSMAITAAAFVALAAWRAPAWTVVIAAGLLGFALL